MVRVCLSFLLVWFDSSRQESGVKAPSSSSSGAASSDQVEWFEKLSAIATLEESAAGLVVHLRAGGMRFVPCAAGARERRALFELVDAALRSLQVSD